MREVVWEAMYRANIRIQTCLSKFHFFPSLIMNLYQWDGEESSWMSWGHSCRKLYTVSYRLTIYTSAHLGVIVLLDVVICPELESFLLCSVPTISPYHSKQQKNKCQKQVDEAFSVGGWGFTLPQVLPMLPFRACIPSWGCPSRTGSRLGIANADAKI